MKSILKGVLLSIAVALLVTLSTQSKAQTTEDAQKYFTEKHWLERMQDPDVDFYELQRYFNKYWEGKTPGKGVGYKQFRRWEYINEFRVLPDGKLPGSDYVMKQYEKYMAEQGGSKSSGANWSFVGMSAYPINNTGQPTGMGRINAIAFHPTNPNTIFVGAPSGGLWKTTNPNGNSTTWINLCNNLPTLGVSSIVINPLDPDIIYIGTGDRDASDAPGIGVYKSMDGGATWMQVSFGMGNVTVGSMVMHPSDPNTIIAATSQGIFKTANGGATWALKQSGNFKDLKFNPGDPTIVYAARSISPAEFYRSVNTGESWAKNTSLPSSSTGSRSVIGVSSANPAYVYVLMTKTDNTFLNLYRSTDYGVTFSAMAVSPPNLLGYDCDGSDNATQATYDLCINVDPADADDVYAGGINIWKTTDGGVTWAIKSRWAGTCGGTVTPVHADQHVMEWSSDGKLYAGHDGGISYTANGGTTWIEITGALPITQIYKIGLGVSNVNVTIFGCQDNGCNGTTDGTTFYTTSGGDGGESVIDYANSNYCYNTYVNGALRRSTTGPLGSYSTIANNGLNGIDETAAFIMPYLLHKTVHTTIFAGYKNVWRSTNITSSPPSFTKISTGETTNCIVLEQSPVNINILYVVRNGAIKRSDNANDAAGSITWTSCALPGGSTPTDLKAHPTDENMIYATAGQKVYKSINKGVSWTDISENLPALPINCLVLDRNGNEAIYIGNETSVWYKDASMSNWILFSNGLPPVDVRELEIYYDAVASNNRIKAGTYGRGLWQSDLATVNIIDPTDYVAVPVSPSQIDLTWTKNAANDNVIIAWAPTIVFGQPDDGTSYTSGNSLPGGGTIIYNGSLSEFSHSSLSTGTTYYYKIWSVNGSNQYSAGLPPISSTTYSHAWTASAGTSDWFTPGNWGTNSVPTTIDNVYIPSGPLFMPQINSAGATCANLRIENGASLTMNNSTAYTLSVAGDWTNNGTFTRGVGTIDFNNSNALQQIRGTSTTTFYTISVSKGSASKMLEAVSQIATSNYLLINSGTFKLNNSLSLVTIGGGTGDRSITSSKGIWLNTGTMLCSGTLYSWGGDIRVSGGTLDLNNRTLEYGNNGNIIIEGGLVKVIRLQPNTTGYVKYTQTGGEIIVGASASTNTSYAPFDLTSASTFTMTGGRITVQSASSFTSDFKNLASTFNVTGGTLQIGNASSPTSSTIRINSTVPVFNLTINALNTPYAQLVTNGLTVKNDVTISGGGLLSNDLDMFVGGNWNKNALFSAGTGMVTFNGANSQTIGGSATTAFNNLTIDGAAVSLATTASPKLTTVSNNLTINSGKKLTIPALQFLTVNGTLANNAGNAGLLILSDVSGTGSLIHNTAGVHANVQRYIAASDWNDWEDGWHFLSSPVAAQAISPAFTAVPADEYDFYSWYEPGNSWVNFKNTSEPPTWNSVNGGENFNTGKGYLVSYKNTGTRDFAGILHHNDVSVSGLTTSSGANFGWHLLGNPYTSALVWDNTWTKTNIGGVINIWNETAKSYTPLVADDASVIPSGNGFMVAVTQSPGSIIIPASKRVHSSQAWYKNSNYPVIRLFAQSVDKSSYQESQLRFDPFSTHGFDAEKDGAFLGGYAPVFYSVSGDRQLMVNSLPFDTELQVPFVFSGNGGSNYEIRAEITGSLPEQAMLLDRKTSARINISQLGSYRFTSADGDDLQRFVLYFSALGMGDADALAAPEVWYSNGALHIHTAPEVSIVELTLLNTSGQVVKNFSKADINSGSLNINCQSGIYLVRIKTLSGVLTRKVIII